MTRKVAPCLVALALLTGCSDSLGGSGSRRDASDPATRDGGSGPGEVVVSCEGAPEGTPCGTPGAGTHCILELCVKNACGDGVRAGTEQCDDGNEADGDSCDSRCLKGSGVVRMDAGGGVDAGPDGAAIDPGASDGSASGDGAPGMDAAPEAGNDATPGAPDTGTPIEAGAEGGQVGPHIDKTACLECAKSCTDVLGADMYAGCFTAVDPQFGATASDPTFIQSCIDTVECAVVHNCGFTEQYQAADCYCGSKAGDECVTTGPALDAPCLAQWRAATRASGDEADPAHPTAKEIADDNPKVQLNFSDMAYPAGWAYYLINCLRERCRPDACKVVGPSTGGASDGGQGLDSGSDAAAEAGADAAAGDGGASDASPATDATADASSDSASADGGGQDAAPVDPACIGCIAQNCRDVLGLDIYAACYVAVDPQFGAPLNDPTFLPQCQAMVECAVREQCGFDPQLQAIECYCGANSGDDCTIKGPAADAPCLSEWRAALRTSNKAEAEVRFVDQSYPAGWAYYLIDCMRDQCSPTCQH